MQVLHKTNKTKEVSCTRPIIYYIQKIKKSYFFDNYQNHKLKKNKAQEWNIQTKLDSIK